MGKTRNNSLRMQQAVKSIFEDYRQKQGCLGHVYEEAACGCNNALQMWRGPKGEKGDKGDKGDPGSNAGSFLVSAEFVVDPAGQPAGSYLKLVLRDENDQLQTVYVDLSELEDVYTAGNGISITDMVIAAKLGAGLTFDNQGNIASAYQFCDGLENDQNTIAVKIDESNNILGFAGSGCKGLTATVGFDIPVSGPLSLQLYGAEGAIIDTVPLTDSATIDVQRTSDGGLTWLVDMEGLISSTAGNQLAIDQTDHKLYVGGDELSYTAGEGTFTLTHPDGSVSSVTVPSAVRMLERADMVCDDGEDPYLLLTFLRDNGQHLYQQVSMGCLFSSNCYETVVDDGDAIIKTVPEQSQQYAILRSINGITTVRTSLYGVVSNQASDLYAHNGQVALSGDDYAGVGTMVTSSLLSIESLDSSDNVIDSIIIPAEVRALPGYGMSAGEASNDVLLTDKKYVQHVSYIDLGSLNYVKASYDVGGTKPFFSVQYAALGIKHADNDAVANIIDGVHRPVSADRHSGAYADMTICVNSDGVIRIADSRYSSAADFKAAMSGVILQYELATPVVTDISQYINDDEIEVVEGGSIRFNSDTGFAVSSTVVFTVGDWYLEGCVRTALQHELRHIDCDISLDVRCDNTTLEKVYYTNAYGHLSGLSVEAKLREGSAGSYGNYIYSDERNVEVIAGAPLYLGAVTDETQIYLRVLIYPVIDNVAPDYALDCSITDYDVADIIAAGAVRMVIEDNPDVDGMIKPVDNIYVSLIDMGGGYYRVLPFTMEPAPVLTADLISGESRVDMKPLLEHIGGRIVMSRYVPIEDISTGAYAGNVEIGIDNGTSIQWITPTSYTKTNDSVTIVTSTLPDIFSVDWLQTARFKITNYVFDWDVEQPVYTHNRLDELLASPDGVQAVVYGDGDNPISTYEVFIRCSMTENSGVYTLVFTFVLGDSPALRLEPSCNTDIDLSPVVMGLEHTVTCETEPVAQSFDIGINIFDGDGSTLAAPVKLTFTLATPESSQEKTFSINFGADGQGGVSISYPYTMFVPQSSTERGFDYFRDESVWFGTFNVHYAVPLSNGCVIDTWATEDPDHPGSNSYGIVHAKLYGPKAASPRMVTFSSSGTVTKTLTQGDTDTMPAEESVFPYPTANTKLYYGESASTAVALTSTAYVSPYLGVSLKLSDNTVVMAAPANSAAWWPNEISHAEIDTTLSNGDTAVADLDCLAGYVSTEFARQDEAIAELTARIDELRDLLFDRTRLQ